ncbi:MAG: PilT/PilU family type 4a pilus ATPase [Candidatus Shapirobacteria bacterium]|nr:PilT/PilU family type 4a pilus ATPase [Candidatus Shapirobacteria bacterium]
MHTKLQELLKLAVANKASDVHLMKGVSPKFRINGELVNVLNMVDVNDGLVNEMIESLLSDKQKENLKQLKELDFSFETAESRFRANVYFQSESLACSLRLIASQIPSFNELNLPDILRNFVNLKQGFVLITGPTGHGKSTTVAAILNEINKTKSSHIVTIEDPVEYLLKAEKSIISQRELGEDANDFNRALRSCLRQDPNVVFIGEMRDLDSIQSALTIAETGHLVFSVLHTNSAAQTVDRIIDVFPANIKEQIKVQLASVITTIVSQRLLPSLDGGRVPAFEILISNPAVKNVIREGKTFMLDNIIQTSADVGMISLDTYLAKLVVNKKISEEVAKNYASNPVDFNNQLRNKKML